MSLPAREVPGWSDPHPGPTRRRSVPVRPPAARPWIIDLPHPHRARRGPHSAFWVFASVVLSSLVVSLVSVNAMRVDAAYEARLVGEQVRLMTDERETLVNDVARLSSPSRIGTWARHRGLIHPAAGDVVILQVPGVGPPPVGWLGDGE